MGNSVIPDAEKTRLTALLLVEFKNRYVKPNIIFVVNQNYNEYIIYVSIRRKCSSIWNSQLSYHVNTSGFYLQILQA